MATPLLERRGPVVTTLATERSLTVLTSESHLKIVAEHFGLDVWMEWDANGSYLVTKREVPRLGTLEYRAPYRMQVSA